MIKQTMHIPFHAQARFLLFIFTQHKAIKLVDISPDMFKAYDPDFIDGALLVDLQRGEQISVADYLAKESWKPIE